MPAPPAPPIEPTPEATQVSEALPPSPTAPPLVPGPTSTPLSPLLLLVAPTGSDGALSETLQDVVSDLAQARGLRWQVRPDLSLNDLTDEVTHVIVLPPAPELDQWVAAAPNTLFLIAGGGPAAPALNLISIERGDQPDQIGFLAGYIAATITPGWRVGVISVEDTPEGQAARIGFQTGVRFFCGLCRPLFPPYYGYPLYFGLPAASNDAEWRTTADFMKERQVETVFVVPGAGGDGLLIYLSELGIQIIGTTPPPLRSESTWVVSLLPDSEESYREYIPRLMDGEAGLREMLPIQFANIQEEIFTPGKQRLAAEILDDLLAGWIDTGAAPNPQP